MRTICSREIFTKKCRQQQIFDSDLKGAWHYNHVTFTQIAKNFMFYCRLIYMLSILCIRLTIKVKVGIPESFKVGWYPPNWKKLGRVTLSLQLKDVGRDVFYICIIIVKFAKTFPCKLSSSPAEPFCLIRVFYKLRNLGDLFFLLHNLWQKLISSKGLRSRIGHECHGIVTLVSMPNVSQ